MNIAYRGVEFAVSSVVVLAPDSGIHSRAACGINVERAAQRSGPDKWAVRSGTNVCLSKDGTWEFESMPSERDNEWLSLHRWDTFDAAMDAALEARDTVMA